MRTGECAMTNKAILLGSVLCLAFLLLSIIPVSADIAPPQSPPGANPRPGESEVRTMVRMVSENVLIVVEKSTAPLEGMENFTTSDMSAQVEAEFTMHNEGGDDEAFEVWFPLGESDGFGSIAELDDFHAWVDDREVKTEAKNFPGRIPDGDVPWATWRTKFPAGEDVNIRVMYSMRPSGYRPFGTFSYILETGAGWYGKIGKGTITFRLPYPVNRFNVALNPDTEDPPNPTNFQVAGTDIIWDFKELEPSPADNIHLTILAPQTWQTIEEARSASKADPSASMAALHLATALEGALQFKYGLVKVGDSEAILQTADEAYLRAIELDPQNRQAYKDYVNFLEKQSVYFMGNKEDPLLARLLPILARALALNPGDEELMAVRGRIEGEGISIPTAVPIPDAGLSGKSATEADVNVPQVSPTSLSVDAEKSEDIPIVQMTPSPSQARKGSPFPICAGGAAAVILPLGVWIFFRKHTDMRR